MNYIKVIAIITALSSTIGLYPVTDNSTYDSNYNCTIYDAWTETGYHLMMSDNGTPDDFDDDFIADRESNRTFIILSDHNY